MEARPCRSQLAPRQTHESILLYDEVRQIQESQLGPDHPDALQVVERMALVYRSQARYAEARSMLEHVLESRKTRLGSDHLHTIQTMDELATTITFLGEYAEAESLHKQALAHRTAHLGTDHPDTLWTADNLATNYRKQGRHLEALESPRKSSRGTQITTRRGSSADVLYNHQNSKGIY